MKTHLANNICTDRLVLSRSSIRDAADLLTYRIENRVHLRPWEPRRSDDFYTVKSFQSRLGSMDEQMSAGRAIHWLIRRPVSPAIVGECNFTQFVGEPFQACYLGFSLSASEQGQGLMAEALSAAIACIFDNKMHRIMANYRHENRRSAKLLHRLGFEVEGIARAYLKIDGKWADHILTAKINDTM
ncbi:MAG: GNAT family N-acetyltransferase [Burkholderiaceae bacterium]|nr:GNAT family N-acetyltransferase [Burkholderiaceae bacterium]